MLTYQSKLSLWVDGRVSQGGSRYSKQKELSRSTREINSSKHYAKTEGW
jgi:hypothetical protein